jgi:V/A-type H+-transporting ATPase subunit C
MHFEGINAKIHTLYGRLLTRGDYESLCGSGGQEPITSIYHDYIRLRHYIYDFTYRDYLDAVYINNNGSLQSYLTIWKKQSRLPDKINQKVMANIIGAEIDLLNIISVYRLKKYFKAANAQIYSHLVPVGHRLTIQNLRRMTEAENEGELLNEISKSFYGKVFKDFINPEYNINLFLAETYAKEARRRPHTLATLASYLFQKKMENMNLTAIKESIAYKLSPDKIIKKLYIRG